MKRFLATTITTLAFLLLAPAGAVFAQAAGGGQALEIGPPVLNLSGDPGQVVKTQISLRDVSDNKLVVSNEINDFVAGGEDGTPKILLKTDETSPYSIKNWITALPGFTLAPKQIQTLTITLKIPANAAPGGYYGVIRFTGTPPGIDQTGVSLSASIGSLVLLKVNGNVKEQVSTADFYTAFTNKDDTGKKNWLFESAPITFIERLQNSGNIHEEPAGTITVTDMFGKLVTTLNVNNPPRNILPASIRKFAETMDSASINNKFLFGKYTAKMDLVYGGEATPLSRTITFWVIPYKIVGAVILGLIVLVLVIRFALIRYRNRILAQTSNRRRR